MVSYSGPVKEDFSPFSTFYFIGHLFLLENKDLFVKFLHVWPSEADLDVQISSEISLSGVGVCVKSCPVEEGHSLPCIHKETCM